MTALNHESIISAGGSKRRRQTGLRGPNEAYTIAARPVHIHESSRLLRAQENPNPALENPHFRISATVSHPFQPLRRPPLRLPQRHPPPPSPHASWATAASDDAGLHADRTSAVRPRFVPNPPAQHGILPPNLIFSIHLKKISCTLFSWVEMEFGHFWRAEICRTWGRGTLNCAMCFLIYCMSPLAPTALIRLYAGCSTRF